MRPATAAKIGSCHKLTNAGKCTEYPIKDEFVATISKGGWPQLIRMTADGKRLFITMNVAGMVAHAERLLPAVSVGASGAIMGLAGAWFVMRFSEPPDAYSRRDVKTIGQVILINLAIGFVIKGIDQSAHIGGLLAGITSGFLLMRIFFDARGVMDWAFPLLLGTLGVVAAAGVVSLPPSDDLRAYRQQVDGELRSGQTADTPTGEDPGQTAVAPP